MSEAPPEAPADARQRHLDLVEEINEHRFRYHTADRPTISDGEYDALIRELEGLEQAPPRPAYARLADPAGRRRGVDAVHPGPSTASR